jgi:hypothetical protein
LNNFYTAYLNNILIYLENKLEYKAYIKKVFRKLRKAGLQADIKKGKFSIYYTKYLEFIVSIEDIKIVLEKIEVI